MALQNRLIEDIDNTDIFFNTRLTSPEECPNILGDVKNQVTIICQNIRSILKNFDHFNIFLSRLKFSPDIIVLTECRLTEYTPKVQLNGYECFYSKCFLNQNDGLAILYKSELSVRIEEPPFQEANCLLIHINTDITICAIYRSPSFYNIQPFCASLEKVLQTAIDRQVL